MDLFIIKLFLGYLLLLLMIVGCYPYIFSKSYNHYKAIPRFIITTVVYFFILNYCFNQMFPDPDNIYGFIFCVTLFALIFFIMRSTYIYYVKGYGQRAAGKRKKPFNFNYFVVGGVIILLILMIYANQTYNVRYIHFIKVLILFSGASAFIKINQAFDEEGEDSYTEAELAQLDTILYIRSFKAEKVPFWSGFNFQSPVDTALSGEALILGFPFMNYFGEAFEEKIGPLVGLGNPVDTIPVSGIQISYEKDGNWQQQLLHHLDRCKAVVMSMGHSENLNWELKKIQSENYLSKFFIFLPPERSNFCYQYLMLFLGLRKAIPTWPEFYKQLREMGYTLPEKKPPPGSIIVFDQAAVGSVLASGLLKPEEYVDQVISRLGGSIR